MSDQQWLGFMDYLPLILWVVVWMVWLAQAVLSAMQVRKLARQLETKERQRDDAFRPPVTLIVPFKGVDPDLEQHLQSLFEQDYLDYELVLIVDSVEDPAYALLQREAQRHPARRATILVAGPCGAREGQKIHNQLFAIDHIDTRAADDEDDPNTPWVWVFADSDAAPGPRWLADMVGPLNRKRIGLTTGYRWLIPQSPGPGGHPTVWSHLASIMNSSIACFYKSDGYTRAWGGAMALLAQTARQGRLRDRLAGALCDDYQFSRMIRELRRRVYFVPWCLVTTPINWGLAELDDFAHRQYLLTRVYAPGVFTGAILLTTLYVVGCVSSWAWVIINIVDGCSSWAWAWPVGAMAGVFIANQMRVSYRREVIRRALGSSSMARLRHTLRLERWTTSLWMTLHWLLILRSAVGRTMRWRSVTYRLYAPQRVVKIDDNPAVQGKP